MNATVLMGGKQEKKMKELFIAFVGSGIKMTVKIHLGKWKAPVSPTRQCKTAFRITFFC